MLSRLLFIGDTHCGLRMALWPEKYADEYGNQTALGPSAKFIWKQLQAIKKMAERDCDELLLILMGDLVHGPEDEYPDQMLTADVKTQALAFIEAILPIASRAKAIYCIDDLSRHHTDEGRFANDFIAKELGVFGKQAYPKLELTVQSLTFALKHHGPALGGRPHTEGDPVRRFLDDIHREALERGSRPPDVFVFAHWHRYWHETKTVSTPAGERTLHAYYTPALCAPDKRTLRNVRRLVLSNIGAIAIDVEEDRQVCHELFQSFDSRVKIRHE